jgi:hypothetical protein
VRRSENSPLVKGGGGAVTAVTQRQRSRSRLGVVLRMGGRLVSSFVLAWCEPLPLAFGPRQTTPAPFGAAPFSKGKFAMMLTEPILRDYTNAHH